MAQPLATIEQQVRFRDGELFVSNRDLAEEAIQNRKPSAKSALNKSVAALDLPLADVPAEALVRQAVVTMRARAPGATGIRDVAQVRVAAGDADESTQLVVDFGAMRTVAGISAPTGITMVQPWLGTQFGDPVEPLGGDSTAARTFPEVQAERLLVTLGRALTPDQLAGGSVTLPTPPPDLELQVNGVRTVFRPGPASPAAEEVDVTAAVQAAVDAGAVPVVLTLRAAVPGVLELDASLDFLPTQAVVFPDGVARVLETDAEGDVRLALPLAGDTSAWNVHEVQMTVSGRPGPERVLPPVDPEPSGKAELVLDADRSVVAGLPPGRVAQLESLSALRLAVAAGPDGAELAGTLLADAAGGPGEALPDGQLGPVTVPPGDGATPAWVTLPLAAERPLVPGVPVWVALQLARGQVVWPVAKPDGDPRLDAPLRRRTPSGTYKELSSVKEPSTDAQTPATPSPPPAAMLRLVGVPPANAPLGALEARVDGTTDAEAVSFTPTADGVRVAIRLATAATAETEGAFAADGSLQLRVTVSAPGSYSFSAVKVAYS
jgi:hypothetical protein